VHIIVDDMSGCSEINWVNNFIVSIIFVAVKVFRLTAVAY
jgi:hypothetical protein